MDRTAQQVIQRMTERGLTLGTAESTIGGLIGHLITDVPGASKVYIGSVVAYHRRPKLSLLHCDAEALVTHGSVSEVAATQMATGARDALDVDIAVSETGVAGPSENPERPGGLYWIAIATPDGVTAERHVFPGDREATKAAAAERTMQLILEYLDRTK